MKTSFIFSPLQNIFSKERIIPFIISLSFFMESLDSTILNTAIPVMAHSLKVHPVNLKISLITYLLSLAIFIPISGWIADKFGIKKIFIGAIIVFTISSFFCGISKNVLELSAARFIQGIGGALNLPLGRLIILRLYDRRNLMVIMGQVVMVGAFGMMLGPLLGGFISHYFSWQWIFWINIPVGFFSVCLAYFKLPVFLPKKVPPLDKLGFIFFGLSLACLTLGLSAMSETSINIYNALFIILIAVIFFLAYVWHSHQQQYPIVNIKLFKGKIFRIAVMGNLFSRLAFGGIPFIMPLLLQIGFGYSSLLSGMLISPLAIGVILAKPLSLPIMRALGYKRLLIINTAFSGLFIWTFTIIGIHTPFFVIVAIMLIYGIFVSLQYSAVNSLAYSNISQEDLSASTSIVSTCQQLAQSLGVAICALLLRVFSGLFSENFILTPIIFHKVFIVLGFIMLLTAVLFTQLDSDEDYAIKFKSN